MRFQQAPRRRPTVNITSLIDVLFLLLTFFLITTSFTEQSVLKVELPSMQHSDKVRQEKRFVLDVDAQGNMHYDGQAVTREALRTALIAVVQEVEASGGLIFRADKSLSYGEVMGLLDLIRGTGIRRVSNAITESGK